MHNFVYLAQRRSQEFSCEPNFGGGGVPPLAAPLAAAAAAVNCFHAAFARRGRHKTALSLIRTRHMPRRYRPDEAVPVIARAVMIS